MCVRFILGLAFVLRTACGLQQVGAALELADSVNPAHKIRHVEAVDDINLIEQVPTGRITRGGNTSAAELSGVAQNEAGDLNAFIAALITNIVTIIVFFLVAGCLRQRYPLVYMKNALTLKDHEDLKDLVKDAPADVMPVLAEESRTKCPARIVEEDGFGSFFGWWHASAVVTIDEVIEYRGLDQAMLLEFAHTAMKILAAIGWFMVFVMGPMHCFLGGYRAGAPGTEDADYLSYWGMANVVDHHPWLYWVHAFVLWMNVIVVQRLIYGAMRDFMTRRTAWLRAMPEPRATTVLVEGIPTQCCRDDKLAAFLNDIFGRKDCVKSAKVIKNTGSLLADVAEAEAAKTALEKDQQKLRQLKEKDGDHKEEIEAIQKEIAEHQEALKNAKLKASAARKAVLQEAAKEDVEAIAASAADDALQPDLQYNMTKAFVTFNNRRDAELAKMMVLTSNAEQYVMSIPPDPADIIYSDLQQDPLKENIRKVLGYALIFGVFWSYIPMVVSVCYFTAIETLAEYIPSLQSMAEDEAVCALWNGMVNALALQLVIGFVPTFFVLIFQNFFVLKANAWLQHRIQEWYYYFQVVFVLLVTAIGSSLIATLKELAENPLSIVTLLAATLPHATHFYLNYLPLQWVTHAQNLMRLAQMFKYKGFAVLFGLPIAMVKGEPEDQDYYGLGSRSARFGFMLTLTLAFCSLSPLIVILGFVNFWMCRKVYGYLVVFAEIRKPDLGGVFYVSQLLHVQQGLFIYIILMVGVLLERDLTAWPGAIAAGTLFFQWRSYSRFKDVFRWESLSFVEIRDIKTPPTSNLQYVQPELRDD